MKSNVSGVLDCLKDVVKEPSEMTFSSPGVLDYFTAIGKELMRSALMFLG